MAAAVPVGGLMALDHVVEPVGRFGIAARKVSMSVLLFSNRSFDAMQSPATVWITDHTASSVRLLFLLLGMRHGFDRLPLLTADRGSADGRLLIGDAALVQRYRITTAADREASKGLWISDLAGEWFRETALPFVFARWVVRKDAPSKLRRRLEAWLESFKDNEPALIRKAAIPCAGQLDMPASIVEGYLNRIRRVLGEEDIQGQRRFMALMRRHGASAMPCPLQPRTRTHRRS
jgi:chorismate dehydratase